MKKSIKSLLSAITVVAAASCAKEVVQTEPSTSVQEGTPVTIAATIDDGAKANLDGLKVVWNANDSIAVYDGTKVNKFVVSASDGTKAWFVGTIAEGSSAVAAVYPYSSNISFAEGAFNVSVPAAQKAVTGGADPSALVMAGAVSDNAVAFKNAVSLIKFSIMLITLPETARPTVWPEAMRCTLSMRHFLRSSCNCHR